MNYTRLIIIIALVLVIAYMNRSVREGFNACPPGESNIGNSPTCGKPGATFRDPYRDVSKYTCKPGFTFSGGVDGFGCSRSTDANGRPVREFGNLICPSGSEAAVSSFASQERDESGNPKLGKTEMCYYPCPAGTVADGGTCVPGGPAAAAAASTPAAAPAATPTRTLADVTKDIDYLKSIGLNEGSENDSMKRLVAERASLGAAPPISTPPYSNSPSALANVPSPSMSCAVENFSSF
jgi:hypothetical protein